MVIPARVKRVLYAWIAVSVCLLAVACGEKKSGAPIHGVELPRATPAPKSEGAAAAPGASELDQDSAQTAQEEVTTSTDKTASPWARAEKLARYDESLRVKVEMFDSSDLTVQERALVEAPLATQKFHFTGAAEDNLVALLKSRLDSVADEGLRVADRQFAQEIGLTSVNINWATRQFTVTALLERDGKREHHAFGGLLQNDLTGQFGRSTTAPEIRGDLVCMDLNGGCRNMRLKFVDTRGEMERTAYVVVRDTPAWMYTKARHPDESTNAEFSRLASIFFNTIQYSGAMNTVRFLNLTTSETVNGSSTFVVTMKIRVPDSRFAGGGEQVLMWTGPLAHTAAGAIEIPVSNAVTVTQYGGVTVPLNHDNGHISDSIKKTRLVANDGKGKIQMAITIRANKPDVQEETILLTIAGKRNQVKYKDL